MKPHQINAAVERAYLAFQRGQADTCARELAPVLKVAPKHPTALMLAGLAEHQRGHLPEAVALLERAAAVTPGAPDSHVNLGNLLVMTGATEKALASFGRALAIDPVNAVALNNRGALLLAEGRLEEARRDLEAAARVVPGDAEVHAQLGHALRRLGELAPAIAEYRLAVRLAPRAVGDDVHRHLAQTLANKGYLRGAAEAARGWLAASPGNAIAEHMIAAFTGESVPARASDAYVRSLFDQFAPTFDERLRGIGYRVPEALADALARRAPAGGGFEAVLDAGCGTGLFGPLARGAARRLVGVDLSPRMLDRARALGCYDELVEGELVAALGGRGGAFDAVASGDTLIYFGALEPLFAATAGALRAGGVYAFSIEKAADDATWELQPHGRYRHGVPYVRRALEAAGFAVEAVDEVVLRKELGVDVAGAIVVARRA